MFWLFEVFPWRAEYPHGDTFNTRTVRAFAAAIRKIRQLAAMLKWLPEGTKRDEQDIGLIPSSALSQCSKGFAPIAQ